KAGAGSCRIVAGNIAEALCPGRTEIGETMKRFAFPLDRVMEWRRTQAQIEESKLERLNSELRDLGHQIVKLSTERNRAGANLIVNGTATGLELSLLDAFRQAADVELARLERSKVDCRRRLETQMWTVGEKRREVRLLENLKDRKFQNWK